MGSMTLELIATPHGRLASHQAQVDEPSGLTDAAVRRIVAAFEAGAGPGLLHLATSELQTSLPASLAFGREIGRRYLTALCHTGGLDESSELEGLDAPGAAELEALVLAAPAMKGLEYLDARVLANAWRELDEHVRREVAAFGGTAAGWLRVRGAHWHAVGRITLHLAENKNDEVHPFAFLATYASRLSERGTVQHLPLARALREPAGQANRKRLLALLTPLETAAGRLTWMRELVDAGDVYQALAWTPAEAHRFLQDIPTLDASGLVVRVPDWWNASRPPRPVVGVRIGDKTPATLGADALLDFSAAMQLDGKPLTEKEQQALLQSSGGLVRLRGRWVEVDRERLAATLAHWKRVEREAREGGLTFFEGMRLLSGASNAGDGVPELDAPLHEWTGFENGKWLAALLARLRDPEAAPPAAPSGLAGSLRPYQRTGVNWLHLVTGLGLGACLADDMGLGKTIQVLALLLHLRQGRLPPSLVVAPASLLANWKDEAARFTPALRLLIAHPSETDLDLQDETALASSLEAVDLVVTTYGMVARSEALRRRRWRLVILDEAQAIKNAGTRQARGVRQLEASGRIALTGTPVENRASDLWSLFDFLNPGLLGDARSFARLAKRAADRGPDGWGALRRLVRPYILRRLKTDPRVIADLPAKTEVRAFCGLSREQVALYEQNVRALAEKLASADGIARRGAVLAALMQLKQICNHPAHWRGDDDYSRARSGKFERLTELCAEIAARQQKVLVFTQFREIAEPLAETLREVFGSSGLVLHGGTPVARRRELVAAFQRDDGPPFLVLSLKAGGTGLNLTAASHVIHFDRWWNPAVENQATDRAFRIGQKRNVLVHKFVCRGTVEEKIDTLIEAKTSLARDLIDEGGELLLTEMSDRELLELVALDIHKACDT